MSLGGQTVTLVAVSEGANDTWGIPAPILTQTPIAGCVFRPLSVEETVAITDKAVQMWELTAEPSAALLAAGPDDRITHDGVTYEIVGGPKPHADFSGAISNVTVVCSRQQTQIA